MKGLRNWLQEADKDFDSLSDDDIKELFFEFVKCNEVIQHVANRGVAEMKGER